MKCVLKDWVMNLTLQMQGTLVTGVRGPDNASKDDPAKRLVRCYRTVILHNAKPLGPDNTFAQGREIPTESEVADFFQSIDQYPHHWWMHFIHCAEIIGYMHPDRAVGVAWLDLYYLACKDMHLYPETKHDMCQRLKADGA